MHGGAAENCFYILGDNLNKLVVQLCSYFLPMIICNDEIVGRKIFANICFIHLSISLYFFIMKLHKWKIVHRYVVD